MTKSAFNNYTPRFNEVERGVYWFHVVRPSVHPSVSQLVHSILLNDSELAEESSSILITIQLCFSLRCPSVCLWTKSVSSTILSWSISYLHILSSNFRRRVLCNGYCKIPKMNLWQIFEICNFDVVLLWHGVWYESIVWVIMGQRWVFSEHRCSSCSSCF